MHELAGLFIEEEIVDPEEIDALEECAEAEGEDVLDASFIAGDKEVYQRECEQSNSDAYCKKHGSHDFGLLAQHSLSFVITFGELLVNIHGISRIKSSPDYCYYSCEVHRKAEITHCCLVMEIVDDVSIKSLLEPK